MSIRETLTDIIKNTIPAIKIIKIVGTDKETKIQGVDENKTIYLEAILKEPVSLFHGAFGIGNIDLLKGLLGYAPYKADTAKITVKRRDSGDAVETIEFRDANGIGSDFRCTSPERVPDQANIKSIPWDISIKPSTGKFGEFAQLAGLFGGGDVKDKLFGIKIVDSKLLAVFGSDHASTHCGSMVLEEGVTATFRGQPLWSHADFISLMKLAGGQETIVRFSSKGGVLGVEIASPIGPFKYYLRAQER